MARRAKGLAYVHARTARAGIEVHHLVVGVRAGLADLSLNEVAKAKEEAQRAQEQAKTAQAEISKAPTGSNNDAELKAARERA